MGAGTQESRADKDRDRNVKEEEFMLWDLEKNQFVSYQLPLLPQTSIQILAPSRRLRARPSCSALAVRGGGGVYSLPPTAAKPPHLLPQASPQEGHGEASTRSPHGLR